MELFCGILIIFIRHIFERRKLEGKAKTFSVLVSWTHSMNNLFQRLN